MRLTRLAPALAGLLAASGLTLLATATPAASALLLGPCADDPTPPCVGEVTRGGSPDFSSAYAVEAGYFDSDGEQYVAFDIRKDGDYDLGAAELGVEWSVEIIVGDSMVPRVASGKGTDVTVERTRGASASVTVTGEPVTVSGQCDQSDLPWVCPEEAEESTEEWTAMFNAKITDYGTWENVAERNAMYGMDYFTNVAATTVPPQTRRDGSTDTDYLFLEMANRHFLANGTTVVQGSAELRIPNSFLRLAYGIPDPETMTATSLVPSTSGTGDPGSITVSQAAADDAMLVEIAGMTFSRNVVRIKRGVLTPTKGKVAFTNRASATLGKVGAVASKARGAKVTWYAARCTAGTSTKTGQSKTRTVTVKRLAPRKAYQCQVRALSKAGPGKWSTKVRLAPRP